MGLFEGSPNVATSYTSSSTETPKWMQDAIYNQIQWSQNVANRPYEQYSMPTTAGLSPLQQQAYQQVQTNQGAWQPTMNTAIQGVYQTTSAGSGLAGANPLFHEAKLLNGQNTAQPYVNQQADLLGSVDYNQPANTLNPYVQQSLNTSGIGAAQPWLNQAAQMTQGAGGNTADQLRSDQAGALNTTALGAAQPYLSTAAQTSAQNINQYMNPYTENVTDRIAQLGARNLSENLLPAVSDSFVRAGSFGGTRMGEFGSRALRDTQESVLGQQAQALQQGYGQALGASGTDLSRQGQLASTAGQFQGQQQNNTLNAAQAAQAAQAGDYARQSAVGGQLANIGQTMGNLTNAQQQAIMQGGQALSSAQQQAISQGLQGAQQWGGMGSMMGGLTQAQQQMLYNIGQTTGSLTNADLSRQLSGYGQLAQMSQQGQGMGYADTAALESAGAAQQNQLQKQYDAAQNQWQQSQLYPQQQLDWLNTQVRGMAPITPQSTTSGTTGSGQSYGPSGLQQLASGLFAYKGLTS